MIPASSAKRLDTMLQFKTRPATVVQELQPGDKVDFWRDPPTKDVSGWRGAAVVTNMLDVDKGCIDVKWQGRSYGVQPRDIRRCALHLLATIYAVSAS